MPTRKPLPGEENAITLKDAAVLLDVHVTRLTAWFQNGFLTCGKASKLGYGRRLSLEDLLEIQASTIYRSEKAFRVYSRLLELAKKEAAKNLADRQKEKVNQ